MNTLRSVRNTRLIEGKTFYNKSWYGSYKGMIERCYRKKAHNYPFYGGRGIVVCEEWKDIEKFENWVNISGYKKGLSLDRIDVNGNYEPDNCRWATPEEQANNRRNTLYVEINGETHTISEWSKITGIKRSTINNRYCRGDRGINLIRKVRRKHG